MGSILMRYRRSVGGPMTPEQTYEQTWRGQAAFVATRLDRAHSAVNVLGEALETGHSRSAVRQYRTARDEVTGVAQEIQTLRVDQPPPDVMPEMTATGSTLVIRGAGAATIALDVIVNAMAALTAAEKESDTDALIGACIDAQQVYADSAAVVRAASNAHGSALSNLERAFDTEGEVALRKKVRDARAQVYDINKRVGGPATAAG